jgi:hypothetical protein
MIGNFNQPKKKERKRKKKRDEPFQFTLTSFHHDGTHATTSEGRRTIRLLLPLGDRAPHAGVDDAFWVDGSRTLREREAVGDARGGGTEGRERESGKRFWAPPARTDTGRNGRGGDGADGGGKGGHYCEGDLDGTDFLDSFRLFQILCPLTFPRSLSVLPFGSRSFFLSASVLASPSSSFKAAHATRMSSALLIYFFCLRSIHI